MTVEQLVTYIKSVPVKDTTRLVFTPDEEYGVNIDDVKYFADLDELVFYKADYTKQDDPSVALTRRESDITANGGA